MRRPDGHRHPAPTFPGLRTALVLTGLILAACAGPTAIPVPAELPLLTDDQGFRLRWALERAPDQVRAVGAVSTSGFTAHQVTLVLYGLDGSGRIVSRAYGTVRRTVQFTPEAFEVLLRPTGREATFDLKIWQQIRPGMQGQGK